MGEELTIPEQVLIEAMQDAQEEKDEANPDGALTTKDLRKITGWGDKKVRRILHILDGKGKLALSRVYGFDLAKRWMPTTAYKIKTGPLKELIAEMEGRRDSVEGRRDSVEGRRDSVEGRRDSDSQGEKREDG